MHLATFILQLLAVSYGVSAGPCRPQSDVSSSLTTEVSSETSLAETISTEVAETSATEISTTETSTTVIFTTETSTTEISTTFTTSESTSTTTESTSTTKSTTTTDSTTSSSETPTPSVINSLRNPGFKDSDLASWLTYASRGTISISTDTFRSGSQSGHVMYSGSSTTSGFYGPADSNTLVAGQAYDVSAWVRQSTSCATIGFGCAISRSSVLLAGLVTKPGAGAINNWMQLKATCTWTQAHIDTGNVGMIIYTSSCGAVSLYADDAVIILKSS
ncbi:hypothetical protein QQX98_009343 [Neonectria punicea]|uniref:CBM-cenC domain-containing protein n=1 Tax=Neonectria punicea TaxID=979145 RepID=A0ABR1GSY9_9HYPO